MSYLSPAVRWLTRAENRLAVLPVAAAAAVVCLIFAGWALVRPTGEEAAEDENVSALAVKPEVTIERPTSTVDRPSRAGMSAALQEKADVPVSSTSTAVAIELEPGANADEPSTVAEPIVERPAAVRAAQATTTTTTTLAATTTAPPAPKPKPTASAEQAAVSPNGPTPAQWEQLRQCEAGGRYDAVNPAGYYGAYQFNQGTWDGVANSIGRSDLVGVRPDTVAAGDQDAMALALYSQRGAQPWPTCGRYLR